VVLGGGVGEGGVLGASVGDGADVGAPVVGPAASQTGVADVGWQAAVPAASATAATPNAKRFILPPQDVRLDG
jgi:hypothetical protein